MGDRDDALAAAARNASNAKSDYEKIVEQNRRDEQNRRNELTARVQRFIESERQAGYPTVTRIKRVKSERTVEHRSGFRGRKVSREIVREYEEIPAWLYYHYSFTDTYSSAGDESKSYYLTMDNTAGPFAEESQLDRFLKSKGF